LLGFASTFRLNATVPPALPPPDQLVDLPGQLTQVAEATGLLLYESNAALLVGLRQDRLVPRPSFFQLNQVRKARAHGLPLRIIAHEDVLVFRQPHDPAS
jgi:modification methylase